uniref:Uncharacterized protein n=1 Tax=Octopus bimaculoides TaxID=37653 RepID=A0A0L8I7G6_OCTBM
MHAHTPNTAYCYFLGSFKFFRPAFNTSMSSMIFLFHKFLLFGFFDIFLLNSYPPHQPLLHAAFAVFFLAHNSRFFMYLYILSIQSVLFYKGRMLALFLSNLCSSPTFIFQVLLSYNIEPHLKASANFFFKHKEKPFITRKDNSSLKFSRTHSYSAL